MQTVAERNRLEALEKGLREVKDRIKRLSVLSEGRDTPFWKALSGELDLSIQINETTRDRALEGDSSDPVKSFIEARDSARAIRAYRGIKLSVESADEKIRSMNEKHREISNHIDEIKKGKTPKASGGMA